MKNKSQIQGLLALLLILTGCAESKPPVPPSEPRDKENAVYYWKTRFDLDDQETAFLKENGIRRIYLRYFDVDYEKNPVTYEEGIVPIGTVSFISQRPKDTEIVPTVSAQSLGKSYRIVKTCTLFSC